MLPELESKQEVLSEDEQQLAYPGVLRESLVEIFSSLQSLGEREMELQMNLRDLDNLLAKNL